MLARLSLGIALFLGSLIFGWWLRRRGRLSGPRARRLIQWAMRWLSPVILCLSFWRLPLRGMQPLLWLPVIGFLVCASTLLPAWWYARRARLPDPQTGSFLTCAFFSNVGYLGAFLAFALFGEAAYGLAVWYLVLFTPSFYIWGFAIARRFGRGHHPEEVQARAFEELRLYPFLGMLLGMALSIARVPRPWICEPLNHLLIPVDTALCLTAIGAHLHLEPLGPWLRHGLAMAAIKFWYSPLIGWVLASLVGLEPLPRFIVLLQASMPVAVSPLMLTVFFGLDRRMASALFVLTILLAIPWLLVYVPLIR